MLVSAVGTLLMRLTGVLINGRRLEKAMWMRHVPLSVLLVLSVSSVASLPSVTSNALAAPCPAVVAGTATITVTAWRQAPLLINMLAGCAVYTVVGMLHPSW
ncbi:hypothetical protein [Streptomyces luteireticuli]|uniref:hypothetical protein n=1 Tax=Streptomyces luteireticuli TaxID=173858 RepID=UPI0035589D2F